MRLSTVSLLAMLMAIFGCEQQSFEYEAQKKVAAEEAQPSQEQSSDANAEATEEANEEENEDDAVEETPEEVVVTPLTNADLLAMDTVVITAVVAANNDVQYFSDVGNTKVTAAGDVTNAAVAPTGTALAAGAAVQVKAGQKLVFCNHASSSADANALRVHAGNNSAFDHWGGNQTLAPGACSFNLGFPEDINANAVGNNPGNNLYNHNDGAGNGSEIYIDVQAP